MRAFWKFRYLILWGLQSQSDTFSEKFKSTVCARRMNSPSSLSGKGIQKRVTSDLNKVFIYVKACSLHDSSDLCDSLQCSNSDVQDSPHSLLQPRPVGILFWACGTLHSPSHRKSRTWSSEVYFKILYFGFSRCTSNFLHTPCLAMLLYSAVMLCG